MTMNPADRTVIIDYVLDGEDRVGSGLLIGTNNDGAGLVLTANHVAAGTGHKLGGTFEKKLAATVLVRSGTDAIDLAILIMPGGPQAPQMKCALVNKTAVSEIHSCVALGWPLFTGTSNTRRLLPLYGDVSTYAGLKELPDGGTAEDFLIFRAWNIQPPSALPGRWTGMSGAVVLSQNFEVLGVVRHHNPREGDNVLGFTPIGRIRSLEDEEVQAKFCSALGIDDWTSLASLPRRGEYKLTPGLVSEHKLAQRSSLSRDRLPYERSEAFSSGRTYLEYDWIARCRSAVDKLRMFCDEDDMLESLGEQLSRLSWRGTHSIVRKRLQSLPLDKMQSHVTRLIRLEYAKPWIDRDLDYLLHIQKTARWLSAECEVPHYGTLFAVMGSWGAGKSRVLDELAGHVSDSSDYHFLFFEPNGDLPFEEDLLSAASKLLGTDFLKVSQLAERLEVVEQRKLVVFIDDLHVMAASSFDYIRRLQELLAEWSLYSSLKWMVTIDAAYYDSVVHKTNRDFWPHYSYAAIGQNAAAGWFDLDKDNVHHRVGVEIIRRKGTGTVRAHLDAVAANGDLFDASVQLMCSPLMAWLRIETAANSDDNHELNLNRSEFVDAYWTRRSVELGSRKQDVEALREVVIHLTHLISKDSPRTYLEWTTAREYIVANARSVHLIDRVRLEEYFTLLVRAGILNVNEEESEEDDFPIKQLEPTIPPFWGYRVAKNLLRKGSTKTSDIGTSASMNDLPSWGKRAATGDWLAEAVCEFALAGLPWNEDEQEETRKVWLNWPRQPDIGLQPLLLAGIWSPEPAQSVLADLLAVRDIELKSKREIFSLVRLAGLASSADWAADLRLDSIQPYYSQVGDEGLGDYFSYMASALIGREALLRDRWQYGQTLTALEGVDQIGDAGPIVKSLVAAGRRIYADEKVWLEDVLTFLNGSLKPDGPIKFPPPSHANAGISPARRDRSTSSEHRPFWERLTHEVVRTVVDGLGLGALDRLMQAGWYSAHQGTLVAPYVGLRIQTQANIALGFLFSRSNEQMANEYLSMLGDLVKGRKKGYGASDQRLIAFFLIRHSGPTYGDKGTRVDARMHPLLAVLASDPMVRVSARKWLKPMCEANEVAWRRNWDR